MRSKYIISVILALIALQVDALVVNNSAGDLSNQVTDLSITTLTVTGSMDARDFYFMADHLQQLSDVDLSGVAIVPCHTIERHYWQQEFVADELPIGAFGDMAVSRVVLPTGLKSIGKAAFAGCTSLTEVVFPTHLDSIADFAFACCSSIESVTLPASVRRVGKGAFMRCSSLASFKVEASSNLVELSEAVLMDCPALQSVVLGEAIHSVGERALAGTGLQELDLTLYRKLRTIEDWALVKTPVTTVTLPSGLTSVGMGAFLYDTELSSISLGGKISSISDYMLAGTSLADLDFTGISQLGDFALYNVSTMPTVNLPSTTTWLGRLAMAGMVGMTSISCEAEKVPELGAEVWKGVDQASIPLTVPEVALEDYKKAWQWRNFLFPTGWLKGDVNGDGEVNVADINAIVNIILGKPADEDTLLRADVNGDGEINIADINAVVNIILHPENQITVQITSNDELHLDDVAICPGQERIVTLSIHHAEAYCAMQCDIILPTGLTLVNTGTDSSHQHETSGVGNTTTRTIVYSMKNVSFDDEGKPVLTFTVRADESLADQSDIVVSNIVLADEENTSWRVADCRARVSNSTGIEDLTADAHRLWVEGRTLCIDTRHAGKAVVSAINGTMCELELTAGVTRYELEAGFYVVVINGKSYKIAIK